MPMKDDSPYLQIVGLEKVIDSCREFSLKSELLEFYNEEDRFYVASKWSRRGISFDVYRGDYDFSLNNHPVCNVLGIKELRAVSVFVKHCEDIDADIVVAEMCKTEDQLYFQIFD